VRAMAKKTDQQTFQAKVRSFVDQLRQEIVSGVYQDGDFLPSEEALSKEYDLSNRSIRQGLDQLVQEGLIEKKPRVGNRVIRKKIIHVAYRDSLLRDVEFNRLLDLFHARYPDIQVQLVRTGVFPSFADGMTPFFVNRQADVVLLNHFDFCDMLESGNLSLLEPLQPQEGISDKLNLAFVADGQQFAMPFTYSPVVLCYNKEHFREAGVSEPVKGWTWDDLRLAAEQLSDQGQRLGFYYHLFSINRWLVFLLQHGVRFTPKGEDGFETDWPLLMESLRFSRDLLRNENGVPVYVTETEEEVMQLFREGRSSMFLATYFSLNEFRNKQVPFDIAPLPSERFDHTLMLTIGWAVNQLSQEKEAAVRFVRFLASPEAQDFIAHTSLSLPALKTNLDPARDECANERPSRFGLHLEIESTYRLHTELMLPLKQLYALRGLLKLYWFGLKDEHTLLEEIKRELSPSGSPGN